MLLKPIRWVFDDSSGILLHVFSQKTYVVAVYVKSFEELLDICQTD